MFSELFFGERAMIVAFSMYVLGLFMAILSAFVMKFLDRGRESDMSSH